MSAKAPSGPAYWEYLRIPELLSLQNGVDKCEDDVSSDELNFIIVHQTLELWFKLILRELKLARDELSAAFVQEEKIPYVVHHLTRVNEIFKVAKDHFNIMETLTPQDFLSFRGKLGTASGFQSYQLREIEIVMGLDESTMVKLGDKTAHELLEAGSENVPGGKALWQKVLKTKAEETLKTALEKWLYRTPIFGSTPSDPNDQQTVDEFLQDYVDAFKKLQHKQAEDLIKNNLGNPDSVNARISATISSTEKFVIASDERETERARVKRIRAAILFIESYRQLPLLAWPRLLLDKVVEMEESFVIWRSRHARMVEREIGRRVGTGGSSGVDYLDQTTNYRVFLNLWTARTAILPTFILPPLKNANFYAFREIVSKVNT